jgi:four helix bundle protein
MDATDDAVFSDWARQQPPDVTGDPVWGLDCFRQSAFMITLARTDAARIARDAARTGVASQLLTSSTSIAANVAEGYGRPTTPDRIRFFSYALGSVRESLMWYEAAAGAIPEAHRLDRMARLVRIRRMLFGLLKRMRSMTGRPCDRW